MTQSHYLKGVLKKFGMELYKPRYNPCEIKLANNDEHESYNDENIKQYREMVGSLIYAMTITRPDL